MSSEVVNQLVIQLVQGGPDIDRLQKLLGTTFKQTDANPYWTFFEGALANGPFKQGDLRLNKAENGQALLSLVSREEQAVTESDLNLLQHWGEAQSFQVSPRIPPEGAVAYAYEIEGVRVSFQFLQTSRQLRTLVVEWGAETTASGE
jgi:hypothetical protein